ncbi:GNAT family N-acetyltransferase [Corynebacterium diphtheriae]
MWPTHDLPILSNKSLILRKLQIEDTPRLVELAQDPAMRNFTTIPSPFTVENALEFISSSSVPTDSLVRWAIATADKASIYLGTIELRAQSPICVDIGYSLHPHARGLGIMPKAVRLVSNYALSVGFHRVEIKIRTSNVASRRATERAGATFEGIAHKAELHRGSIYDLAIYSITS